MPTMMIKDNHALLVRERLLKRPRNVFLRDIADKIGVSERWLQQLIAGKSEQPSPAYIKLLEEYLNENKIAI